MPSGKTDANADKAKPGARRGIQSIEVGFRLIRVLEREGRKLPLKTLAHEAGMPPSKAHLYLVSFARLGLIVQDPVTARYGLGPYAIQLGLAGISQIDLVDVAHGPMTTLQEETGLSVSLSIWGNRGPTLIQKVDGPLPIPVTIRVGFVLPLLNSATGRIFVSYLPKREWATIAEHDVALGRVNGQGVDTLIEDVRAVGIASSDSQVNEGFAALSAPVFDHEDRLAAAITVLGLRSMVDHGVRGEQAGSLSRAAGAISLALGSRRLRSGDRTAARNSPPAPEATSSLAEGV